MIAKSPEWSMTASSPAAIPIPPTTGTGKDKHT